MACQSGQLKTLGTNWGTQLEIIDNADKDDQKLKHQATKFAEIHLALLLINYKKCIKT